MPPMKRSPLSGPLLAAVFVAALPAGARADDQAMSGAGTVGCARYNADLSNRAAGTAYVHWAQGYLSGFSTSANVFAKQPWKKMPTPAELKAAMDAWCSANPAQPLVRGLLETWKALPALP